MKFLSCLLNSCASELRTELRKSFLKDKEQVLKQKAWCSLGWWWFFCLFVFVGFFPLTSVCTENRVAIHYYQPSLQISVDVMMPQQRCHILCRGNGQERRTRAEGAVLALLESCRLAVHVVVVCKNRHSMQKRRWDLPFHLEEKRMIALLHLV